MLHEGEAQLDPTQATKGPQMGDNPHVRYVRRFDCLLPIAHQHVWRALPGPVPPMAKRQGTRPAAFRRVASRAGLNRLERIATLWHAREREQRYRA
jgi:hypothetical protein